MLETVNIVSQTCPNKMVLVPGMRCFMHFCHLDLLDKLFSNYLWAESDLNCWLDNPGLGVREGVLLVALLFSWSDGNVMC